MSGNKRTGSCKSNVQRGSKDLHLNGTKVGRGNFNVCKSWRNFGHLKRLYLKKLPYVLIKALCNCKKVIDIQNLDYSSA